MSERKPSPDAVSSLLDAVKPRGVGLGVNETVGAAPSSSEATPADTDRDPSPENFFSRGRYAR